VFATTIQFMFIATLFACSGGSIRAAFHATDPSFRGAPGPAPKAFLESEIEAVPKVRMRSVGLIEVTVPASSGIRRAIEVAVDKGREVGCWILIEHAAFATVQSRASLSFGARVFLAHGGGGHDPAPSSGGAQASDGTLTAEFDCVMQADVERAERGGTTRDDHDLATTSRRSPMRPTSTSTTSNTNPSGNARISSRVETSG